MQGFTIQQYAQVVLSESSRDPASYCGARRLNGRCFTPPINLLIAAVDQAERDVDTHDSPAQPLVIDNRDFSLLPYFDLALTYKLRPEDVVSSLPSIQSYKLVLFAALVVYRLAKALLESDAYKSVYFFNDYSPMTAMALAARAMGRKAFTITNTIYGGGDFTNTIILNRPEILHRVRRISLWPYVKEYQLMPGSESILKKEISSKIYSTSHTSYSPSVDVFSSATLLRLDQSRPRIALFPSSNDEFHATKSHTSVVCEASLTDSPNLYSDQREWILDIAQRCQAKGIQLVVRCHPRIDADHRGLGRSAEYDDWIAIGQYLESIGHIFIHPSDRTSSYLLIFLCHAVFISWSSIGIESSLLGRPTYQFFNAVGPLRHYPDDADFLPHVNTSLKLDQLLETISNCLSSPDSALSDSVRHRRITYAARFYIWYRHCNSLRLFDGGSSIQRPVNPSLSEFFLKDPTLESWPEDLSYMHLLNLHEHIPVASSEAINNSTESDLISHVNSAADSIASIVPVDLRNLWATGD